MESLASMSPTFWAAAASVCAVIGFGLTLVLHLIKYSYQEGQKDQRLAALEGRPADTDCKRELAVLTTKFEALEKTLSDIAYDVKNLITGKVVPARRRAAED